MSICLKYGNTNTFFINGLLFDTDMPGTLNSFYRSIKENGISLNDIKYVLCSHYHPDHMGLVSDLMGLGIKPVVVQNQKDYVHSSDEILRRQFGERFVPIDEADAIFIATEESRDFLKGIGIDGIIVATTSHSPDGIALILDNGECFVGDLEPYQFIDGYENNEPLKKDWSVIMDCNPRVIFYGHITC